MARSKNCDNRRPLTRASSNPDNTHGKAFMGKMSIPSKDTAVNTLDAGRNVWLLASVPGLNHTTLAKVVTVTSTGVDAHRYTHTASKYLAQHNQHRATVRHGNNPADRSPLR